MVTHAAGKTKLRQLICPFFFAAIICCDGAAGYFCFSIIHAAGRFDGGSLLGWFQPLALKCFGLFFLVFHYAVLRPQVFSCL